MIALALVLFAGCSAVLGACGYIAWYERRARNRLKKFTVRQGALWPNYMCEPGELKRLTSRAHKALRERK